MAAFHCIGRTIILLVVATILGGCGNTPPARLYALSSLATADTPGHQAAGQSRQVVGIGPLALAKYLQHPAIISRSGPTTLTRSELDRWAGSLGDEISRVLVENLRHLLPAERFVVMPWLEAAVNDYRVQLTITRFEGTADGVVVLNAVWLLFADNETAMRSSGNVSLVEPLRGDGHAAIVEAMSEALAVLSRRVAEELIAVVGVAGTG